MNLNLKLLAKTINLNQQDILWGYENSYLGWVDIIEIAKNSLIGDVQNNLILELSLVDKSSIHTIKKKKKKLAGSLEGYNLENGYLLC